MIYHAYHRFPHFLRLAMSIENPMLKFLHFLRLAMCGDVTCRSSGTETSRRMVAIDMLLLWSKDMRFGCVGSVFCSIELML